MVRAKVPAEMSTADVVTLLEEWKMDHAFQEAFEKHGFDGYTLMSVTKEDIDEEFPDVRPMHRRALYSRIQSMRAEQNKDLNLERRRLKVAPKKPTSKPGKGVPNLKDYIGLRIKNEKSLVELGVKSDVKLFRGSDGKLNVAAKAIELTAGLVTVNGIPLTGEKGVFKRLQALEKGGAGGSGGGGSSGGSGWLGYQLLGVGHCKDWVYLPEGGYPAPLPHYDPLYSLDRVQECLNRCVAASKKKGAKMKAQAFYVRADKTCACSQGACTSLAGSKNYKSYRIVNKNGPKPPMPAINIIQYQLIGAGYCADWNYLPEGGYPKLLNEDHKLYDSDRVQECLNRCVDASKKNNNIQSQAFYVDVNSKCACSKGTCQALKGSGYKSYKIYMQHIPAKINKAKYQVIGGTYSWKGTKVPRLLRLCELASKKHGVQLYPILNEAGCKAAAKALKRTYSGNGNWCPSSPPGCYRNSPTSNFWFNKQVCSEPSVKAETDNGHHFYAQQICTTEKPKVPLYSTINGPYAWTGSKVPRLKRLCNFARDGMNAHYPILDEASCKAAAKALKRTYSGNGNWCPGSPPGCYRNSDKSNFWFNKQTCAEPAQKAPTDNAPHFYAQQICTSKRPKYTFIGGPYVWKKDRVPRLLRLCEYAHNGADQYYPILTEDECKAAAKALGRTYSGNGNWCPNSPPGCYRNSPTSKFWFNKQTCKEPGNFKTNQYTHYAQQICKTSNE